MTFRFKHTKDQSIFALVSISPQTPFTNKAQSFDQRQRFGIIGTDKQINASAIQLMKGGTKSGFQHVTRTPMFIDGIDSPPHIKIGTITAKDESGDNFSVSIKGESKIITGKRRKIPQILTSPNCGERGLITKDFDFGHKICSFKKSNKD